MSAKRALGPLIGPFVISIAIILVCIAALWWMVGAEIGRYRQEQLLAAGSRTTSGTVLARNQEYDSNTSSTTYTVRYRYTGLSSEDEQRYEYEVPVSFDAYSTAEVGGPIEVRYATADPSIARIRGEPGPISRGIGVGIFMLCALTIIVCAGYYGVQTIRERW